MSVLAALRSNWRVVASVALFEICAAWAITESALRTWIAPIRSHPDGAAVLFAHGSRGLLDFLRLYPDNAHRALVAAGAGIAGYALASLIIAAVLPVALAAPSRVQVSDAWRKSFRLTPQVVIIAFAALVASVVAVIGGGFLVWGVSKAVENMANVRTADLLRIAAVTPSLFLLGVVRIWSDLAITGIAATGERAPGHAVAALRTLKADLWRRAAAYVVALLLSAAVLLVGFSVHPHTAYEGFGFHLVAVVVAQQICAALRVVIRAGWFAYLATPWRRPS